MYLSENELRKVYTEKLIELAEKDSRVVVLEADLMGASGTKPFKERFPERLIDVGVAEANMMGVSAGLAVMGKIPFANSFTPFATRRAFDQVTISIAYANLNVKIGGTDPGVTAELNGGTHMSFEDAGIMRNLARMTIIEPADEVQLANMLPKIKDHNGPVYIRIHRKNKEVYFEKESDFEIGKIFTMKDGNDITIICSGLMIKYSLEAVDILEKEGISVRLLNMHTLKPVDSKTIIKAAKETGAIVTAENHSIINGWGSAVAEVLAENYPTPLKRIGVRDHFGEVGKTDFLIKKYKMDTSDIVEAVKETLKRKK